MPRSNGYTGRASGSLACTAFSPPAHPGTYTVWLRGYAPNGAGDSLYVTLDNNSSIIMSDFRPRQWDWASHSTIGMAVIEVDTPGLHTLTLSKREDGLRLDKVILTTALDFNPVGAGPAKTPQLNRH